MVDGKKIKNYVIFSLLFVIVIMTVAIVVLAYNNPHFLSIDNGNGDGIAWKVEFTDIKVTDRQGEAINRFDPYYLATYASFYVDFKLPNDSITYDITLSNLGILDARLTSITRVEGDSDVINYEIDGINEGDVLKAGDTTTVRVKVSYETSASVGYEATKPLSLSFFFEQAY